MPAFDPSDIDVADFLDCLDIRNVRRATEKEFCFSCPYPAHTKGDESPSAYMNANSTAFLCHSCHARGNAVSFTSDILGVSPLEATRMLKQRYSPGGIDPSARDMVVEIRKVIASRKRIEPRRNRILSPDVLSKYAVDWHGAYELFLQGTGSEHLNYMFSRGFHPDTLTDWGFGFSIAKNRITLPIHDEDGRLVGIKARAWNERRPKYLNLKDEENDVDAFLKNDVVFALHRARYTSTHLIVVEGEFNAIAMHAFSHTNTVAINGSYYGARQIHLLKLFADEATLFFDSDTAGRDATEQLANDLRPFMPVYICPDHWGDPAEMHRNSIAACLKAKLSYSVWRLAAIRPAC
jgi:DNA primase